LHNYITDLRKIMVTE